MANSEYRHTVDRRFTTACLESLIKSLIIAVVMYANDLKLVSMLVKNKIQNLFFSSVVVLTVISLSACGGATSSGDGDSPGVLEVPIAYIKRPIPTSNQGDPIQLDFRDPAFFTEGGDLYLSLIHI